MQSKWFVRSDTIRYDIVWFGYFMVKFIANKT